MDESTVPTTAPQPPLTGLAALRDELGDAANLYGCGAESLGCLTGLGFGLLGRLAGASWWHVAAWCCAVPVTGVGLGGAYGAQNNLSRLPVRLGWLTAWALAAVVWWVHYGQQPAALGGLLAGCLVLLGAMEALAARARRANLARWGLPDTVLATLAQLPQSVPEEVAERLDALIEDYRALHQQVAATTDLLPDAADLRHAAAGAVAGALRVATLAARGTAAQRGVDPADLAALEAAGASLREALAAVRAVLVADSAESAAAVREQVAELRLWMEGRAELDQDLSGRR